MGSSAAEIKLSICHKEDPFIGFCSNGKDRCAHPEW